MKASLVVPAVVLAAGLAGAPSRAPAYPLDYQGHAYSSGYYHYPYSAAWGYGGYGGYGWYGGYGYYSPRVHSTFMYSRPSRVYVARPYTYMYRESYPVRHRPRYHDSHEYDDRGRYEPHYYAALG